MFLDIAVSFAAITVLVLAGISITVYKKRQYSKLHPPEISAYEKHRRQYISTGDEKELLLMQEAMEVEE